MSRFALLFAMLLHLQSPAARPVAAAPLGETVELRGGILMP